MESTIQEVKQVTPNYTKHGHECGAESSCHKWMAEIDGHWLSKERALMKGEKPKTSFYWEDSKEIHSTLESCLNERGYTAGA